MKPCPYCAETIEDQAQVCPFCNTSLVPAPGVSPPPLPADAGTSGKAIASLVCGTLFLFFPSAIVAVIMGHLSLSDIKRSAGRLGGRGMAIAGLALGYTGIAVLPILIIAAIAIPNFLRAKIAANEASAVGSLRTIGIACFTYARNYNSYPPSLASLGPGTQPGPGAANLIDTPLSLGQRHGYVFTYDGKANASGTVTTYALYADPITEGQTGVRHFYLDQTGVFRVSVSGRATEDSPPLM